MRRSGTIILACAMAPLLSSSLIGCHPASDGSDTSESAESLKARSPECVAARDACHAQAQPLVDSIAAACAPVEAACAHHAGSASDAGTAAATTDASASGCADARAACSSQLTTTKPALKAVGDACATSIRAACTVHRGTDGGAEIDGGSVPPLATSSEADAGGSGTPCRSAEQMCHQQLGDIRAMPPAECAGVQAACGADRASTASEACKMAASACHSALQTAVSAALDSCGKEICAACKRKAP